MKIRGVIQKVLVPSLLAGVAVGCTVLGSGQAQAAPGINQQMNFQGRLYNAQGATVPDGFYNIQFKIYQDGDGQSVGNTTGTPAGTLEWTESHLNADGKGLQVKNGFMSAQLGSITAFGTSVDWNQDTLWLSMNIAGINATCTPFTSCSPDGEMIPMKRLSTTPYSLNSGLLGGLASSQFVQLAQGVQTDAANNTNSIFINKTGTGGNFLSLQGSGTEVFSVTNNGNIVFGNGFNHTIGIAAAIADDSGRTLTISGGAGGSGASALPGGPLILQGGAGGGTNGAGGNIVIDGGLKNGTGANGSVVIGTGNTANVTIGNPTLASGSQTISIGNNASAGTTNVTIGATGTAGGGTTTLQAKSNITINTDGVARGTFDTANSLYLGNGVTAAAPNNFTLRGTGSSTTAVAGSTLTVQGGNATVGNANGGNLTLSGGTGFGTGVGGLVVITTPTFSTTANDPNCYTSGALVASTCTIAASSVNNSSAILVGFSTSGQSATLPDPTTLTAGRIVYVTAANSTQDFTLIVNGGGTGNSIAMRQNTTATMIWNGSDWTAAGASSSTTLQSAYDNTLQSAGGAELVLGKTTATNGLTIRDTTGANAVNGTLVSIQTGSAASLFSVNSNVTEYASNGGAEVAGGTATTFPSNTWTALTGATASRQNTAGDNIATGQGSVSVVATGSNGGVKNQLVNSTGGVAALTANTTYNVSFTTRLLSGTFTDMAVYYSIDGSAASVTCITAATSVTSVWSKVNCSFTTPSSGITTGNAVFIRQTTGSRTFYIDNLSVTIAADYNFATDGGASDAANFATNWSYSTGIGTGTVTRNTGDGYNASDSAQVAITAGAANAGVRNRLSSNPLPDTLYRVTAYARLLSGTFSDFKIRYSRDNGTNYVDCVDYNTQTITTTGWTKVTCYIKTDLTAASSPYVYFVESSSAARTFMVDAFSMTLRTSTTPNVQIGGGVNGGPTTLLTLDKGASAPIASDNDALLGSMYYDTTLGKLQCYEADGWGACGSSPDNVVTISPEYTNAVMHGTGIGTMTSDLCSDTLNINDPTNGPTICGVNETYNFYKWTSPQATPQEYGIYVTYQLPSTFKEFASGQTSLMGRTDSANSTVTYQIYRNDNTGLTPCSAAVSVSTGVQTTWQTKIANGAADPSTCGFDPGNSIVFKIVVTASSTANAYVGNLNFTFSNR